MKKIFIGIDFSKEKFDATLIKAEGLKECAPSVHEVFDNKTSGYRCLAKWVKAHADGCAADAWLFCGENTGGYSIGLSNYLYASGYDMWLECAYKIKHSAGIDVSRLSTNTLYELTEEQTNILIKGTTYEKNFVVD